MGTRKPIQTGGWLAQFHDGWLICVVLALIVIGLLMVASSSIVIADKQFGHPFHYFFRQLVFVGLGLVTAAIATRIPMTLWERYAPLFLLLGLLLLAAVLMPGIGRAVNGSRRWIAIPVVSIQSSVIAQLSVVVYLARYLSRYSDQVRNQFLGFLKPIILLAIVGVLLLMEPDFGSLAVLSMTVLLMLFLAGIRLLPMIGLLLMVSCAMSALAIFSPYRLERLLSYWHPWHHAFGSGYQLTQSLIAFGRGGLFGVGLGNSIQKLFYLPEAHTDFVFAVLAEELGLIGALAVIGLFCVLVCRILSIAGRSRQIELERGTSSFNSFVAYGGGLWLSLQVLINIGVNTGLLPTKGLSLPFISYGGMGLVVNCLLIGMILRIAHEVRSAHYE